MVVKPHRTQKIILSGMMTLVNNGISVVSNIDGFSSRLSGSQVQVRGMMTLVKDGIGIGCVSSRLSVSLFKWQLLAFYFSQRWIVVDLMLCCHWRL